MTATAPGSDMFQATRHVPACWTVTMWCSFACCLQVSRGCQPDVWYQLLLACAATAECRATLDAQLPGIVQQLQDSGHVYGTTALELAREVGRARAHEAEVEAALKEAKERAATARAKLLQQLTTEHRRFASVVMAWP